MALTLKSSFDDLNEYLETIRADKKTDAREALDIRRSSDEKLDAVAETLKAFDLEAIKKEADELFRAIQTVARQARRQHLPEAERDELQKAVEYQLGYVVAGYQVTIERL